MKTLTCKICDRTFTNLKGLSNHQRYGCPSLRVEDILTNKRKGMSEYFKTEKGILIHKKNRRKLYLKSPEKDKARVYLRRAVLNGTVTKEPCEKCNTLIKVEAHHANGYSNPLDVQWLCFEHHRIAHGRYIQI